MIMYTAYKRYSNECEINGEEPVDFDCFIVGDDIVMPSSILPYYKEVCSEIGVPINNTKCFSNKKIQFCGYEIDKIDEK